MIGTTLGHYRIVSALGQGGMGEVFLAHDTKLDRKVALKVLPASVSSDAARRERFTREARAIASLSHPNIVTVYSVEDENQTAFLTMELIEGRTLSDVLPAKGMSLDQLLKTAIPLADAVSAAHARGITHRDLKPANVMVTTDGRVKVLDFGLAKLREEHGADASVTALQPQSLTGDGRIVGTVSYMSPEQAEGKQIDHRSDIFSLGVMLYEMSTGERPFRGDSTVSTLSSVLRDTPRPITELNPRLPRELSKIVRRMLAKDPEHRIQSAKDVRIELEELKHDLDSGELALASASGVSTAVGATGTTAPVSQRRTSLLWATAVVAIGAAAWFGRGWLGGSGDALLPMEVTFTQLTYAAGIESNPSLSPDGKSIVYASGGDILLQSVGGRVLTNLTKDELGVDWQPVFSPNGDRIVFRSQRDGGGLFVMTRTGEDVKRLTKTGFDPSWTPDGRFIIYASATTNDPENRTVISEGWKVEVETGQSTQLTAGDFVQPAVSPNGERIAYWALPVTDTKPVEFSDNRRDLWMMRIDGSDIVRLTNDAATDWNPIWAPDGKSLFFVSDRGGSMNLWRLPVDETTGRVRGEPVAQTVPAAWVSDVTRSKDGKVFAFVSNSFTRNISRAPFDPVRGVISGPPTPVTRGTLDWRQPMPSPDGTNVLMTSYHRTEDIYIAKADGSTPPRNLTNDVHKDRYPVWLPDGSLVMFYSNRDGPFSFWSMRPDGSELRQRVKMAKSLTYSALSPDASLVAGTNIAAGRVTLFKLTGNAVIEAGETLPPIPGGGSFSALAWSPDGNLIAGQGGGRIYVYSLEKQTYATLDQGSFPQFLSDSRRILYAKLGRLYLFDLGTTTSREIRAVEGELLEFPVPQRDNRFVFFQSYTAGADIWLMTVK